MVPGGKSPLVCLISTRWMVVANAAIIATARTAAKIAKVICVRRRLLQLRSLFMGNTLSNMNQRNPLEPVPLLPPSSSDLSRLHLARPRPQSSAANIYPPPPPAKIRSHPHRVVAIIVRDRPHRHRGRRSRTRRSCGSGDGGSRRMGNQRLDDVGHDRAAMAFPNLTAVESVNFATCRACDGRSWSHGILFGSICCESKGNLRLPGRLRKIAANRRSPQ